MSWSVYTSIEIAAPPEAVRNRFLDFSKIREYSPNGYVVSMKPQSSSDPLAVGNKIDVEISIGKFVATIVENTSEQFAWSGGVPYIFTGIHRFRFLPSQITPGHTLFVQEEDFSGLLGFMSGANWFGTNVGMATSVRKNYTGFNEDLKREMERS